LLALVPLTQSPHRIPTAVTGCASALAGHTPARGRCCPLGRTSTHTSGAVLYALHSPPLAVPQARTAPKKVAVLLKGKGCQSWWFQDGGDYCKRCPKHPCPCTTCLDPCQKTTTLNVGFLLLRNNSSPKIMQVSWAPRFSTRGKDPPHHKKQSSMLTRT
jgi:hypothetical protein